MQIELAATSFLPFKRYNIDNQLVINTMFESHFHISEPFELDTELNIDYVPSIGTLKPLPPKQSKKDGVLLVMMERYEDKSRLFLPNGTIAVGLKDTLDSKNIIQNMDSIGYILFHQRKDANQHLFVVDGVSGVIGRDKTGGVYANVRTTDKYLLVRFRPNFELPSNLLHSSKMEFEPRTRYDSQFASLDALQ